MANKIKSFNFNTILFWWTPKGQKKEKDWMCIKETVFIDLLTDSLDKYLVSTARGLGRWIRIIVILQFLIYTHETSEVIHRSANLKANRKSAETLITEVQWRGSSGEQPWTGVRQDLEVGGGWKKHQSREPWPGNTRLLGPGAGCIAWSGWGVLRVHIWFLVHDELEK